ncbi:iron(III) ABC transporter ATP-binding protein [Bacteroidia bacterium]|nr:iron(III) ABC transporter ATP-binding protein [Bacteroidia bacterium]
MNPAPVIQTSDLSIGYAGKGGKRKRVHDGLSLELLSGQVTCLLGMNGAGKSTLLRTLAGFQLSLSGDILVMGKPLQAYYQSELSLAIGVVLTEKTNAGDLTAYDLVSLGRHPYTGFFGTLKTHDREVIEQSIEAVGMTQKAQQLVAEMSDGERQKIMIAKTLAQESPIILLDEPTAFLDIASRIETMILLRKLAIEQGKAILLSTHDIEQAIQMGDFLWLLDKNRPLLSGTPEDLILDGSFASFFRKENMDFDLSTGKLTAKAPTTPIGIEGDPLMVYWVSNALIRNGWMPTPSTPDNINIICNPNRHFIITFPDGARRETTSIQQLLQEIHSI